MSDTLLLTGQLAINPPRSCAADSDLSTIVNLSESMTLAAKQTVSFVIPSDAAFPIDLTATPNVNMLFIDASAKVMLTITTADGAVQTLPVDPMMLWFSSSVPITALSVTRVAATDTTVHLILGDKS